MSIYLANPFDIILNSQFTANLSRSFSQRHRNSSIKSLAVTLEDDYCTNGFCYFVEVTTPQFLSTTRKKEKSAFLLPDYPCIIVSKLTDDIIRAVIESFMNLDDEVHWLKMYHVIPKLTIQEINEILYRKKIILSFTFIKKYVHFKPWKYD